MYPRFMMYLGEDYDVIIYLEQIRELQMHAIE